MVEFFTNAIIGLCLLAVFVKLVKVFFFNE